jgi:hypothetical protein
MQLLFGARFLTLSASLLLTSILSATTNAQVKKSSFIARNSINKTSVSWTTFAPASEKFGVLMPANPTVKKEIRVIGQQQLLVSYYGTRQGDSDYAVLSVAALSDINPNVAHMLMLDLYGRLNGDDFRPPDAQGVNTINATYQNDILLDGYVGRQFSLKTVDRIGEWRFYRVGEKFYAVAASTSSRNDLSLKRFLNSFTFSLAEGDVSGSAPASSKREDISNSPAFRWLIILQTFSKAELVKATHRMNILRSQGYDARVIDTNSYGNLRPGLLALTMGPYSKQAAEERLVKLRSVAPQSYIKSGW